MPSRDKDELISKDNETLNRLKLGANESGSCDYPNIQRFGFTSKEKKSSDEESNQME
ncbi:hypothetical protein [Clostridium sp. OS1-26]|uniref:hypothetical protein n=1 Tax=Clostridium sp. OS1-26 TaxID=3070681 RepID=UPI0027E040FE|nr:hypothetical protein [Clostridium sp. OS1-26]WML35547.1 hypothetical protein RCG18_01970 [Clostridium sp. OS1-26]